MAFMSLLEGSSKKSTSISLSSETEEATRSIQMHSCGMARQPLAVSLRDCVEQSFLASYVM